MSDLGRCPTCNGLVFSISDLDLGREWSMDDMTTLGLSAMPLGLELVPEPAEPPTAEEPFDFSICFCDTSADQETPDGADR
jgi:hypothetical protein